VRACMHLHVHVYACPCVCIDAQVPEDVLDIARVPRLVVNGGFLSAIVHHFQILFQCKELGLVVALVAALSSFPVGLTRLCQSAVEALQSGVITADEVCVTCPTPCLRWCAWCTKSWLVAFPWC
jgi:hypothetical protein